VGVSGMALGFSPGSLRPSEFVVGAKNGRRAEPDTPTRRHPPELRLRQHGKAPPELRLWFTG